MIIMIINYQPTSTLDIRSITKAMESFIHTGPLVPGKGGENISTAFFLTR